MEHVAQTKQQTYQASLAFYIRVVSCNANVPVADHLGSMACARNAGSEAQFEAK